MKAITMIQPWGTLVLDGRKTIETRKWSTRHRGDLLFTAGKKFDRFVGREHSCPRASSPQGVALCVARVVDVRPLTPEDYVAACLGSEEIREHLGIVTDGKPRFAWVLEDVRSVVPFEVRGALGLFDVDDSLIRVRR